MLELPGRGQATRAAAPRRPRLPPRPLPPPLPRPAPPACGSGGEGRLRLLDRGLPAEGDNVEIEPMSKIRQITAAHMVYSKATSAHVTTVFHMDFSKVDRIRARAKDSFFKKNGTKLSYMPFIFKAVATALQAHRKSTRPSTAPTSSTRRTSTSPWPSPRPRADRAGHQARRPAEPGRPREDRQRPRRPRAGEEAQPDEAQGGTFTITNPGVFGSLFGTPVINQPQVAILGIGAIEKRPIVIDRRRRRRHDRHQDVMAYFGITYDHRLVDGADADHFMNSTSRRCSSRTPGRSSNRTSDAVRRRRWSAAG